MKIKTAVIVLAIFIVFGVVCFAANVLDIIAQGSAITVQGPVGFSYIDMNGGKITGLPANPAVNDGASVAYVNTKVGEITGVTTSFVDGLEADTMNYINETVNVDVAGWLSQLSSQGGRISSAEQRANALDSNLVDRGWWHSRDSGDCMLWEDAYAITPFCPIEVNCSSCACFRADVAIYGNLTVNGYFYVSGTKNFVIDHPTREGMELVHSVIEGPEVAVFYRGEGQLTEGQAAIELPKYFEALTREEGRTVFLTPKSGSKDESVSQLAAFPVKNGKLKVVAADNNNPNQKFYWEVKAVRADVEPLEVEIPKEELKHRELNGTSL